MNTKTDITITAEMIVKALDDLGGEATTDEVKAYFGIDNGHKLAGGRRGAVSKGWIAEDGPTMILPNKPSMRHRAPNHTPNARHLSFEAFIDALINLGGEATTHQLKEYFDLDTGNRLSGVRQKSLTEGLVSYEDGSYKLVDKWSSN